MKNKIYNEIIKQNVTKLNKLIDIICDDVDGRICKNCDFFNNTYAPTCDLGVVSEGLFGNGIVKEDFGCNKFQVKKR